MMMTCIHCANVMKLEDPKVPLRCGAEYFAQPAILRQAQRLDRYRPVDPHESCLMWTAHPCRALPVLKDSQVERMSNC